MKLLNKLMFSCHRVSELVALNQPLSGSKRLKLKLHLFMCNACQAFLKQDQLLNQKMKQIHKAEKKNIDNTKLASSAIEKIIDKK